MEKILDSLTERLKKTLGERLVSVILYGSAASGDAHAGFSDLNVFCALERLTPAELADAAPALQWWRERGQPAPLLMSRAEVAASTDCFPIEFHDMLERRRVLYGEDVISGLEVDDAFYRAQVEHELRAKLLRLRQKAIALVGDKEMLLRLLADSAGTFCILARHALRLAGHPAPWRKRDILAAAGPVFGFEPGAFYTLVDLREGRAKPRAAEVETLFTRYLEEIGGLIAAVDRLER
jgi:predicted nucleotidyltransferase